MPTISLSKTFAELYCEQNRLALEDYDRAIVSEALYPHARALHRLFQLVPGDYFHADLEFVRHVGQLTRARDFSWEVSDFHAHPANRRALRRNLKVRLSITRLRHIVKRTFAQAPKTSAA
jgi:hypothetical protein